MRLSSIAAICLVSSVFASASCQKRRILYSWYQCIECQDGEIRAVEQLGSNAVGDLTKVLNEGVPGKLRVSIERQLQRDFVLLNEYRERHGGEPLLDRARYVQLHINRADDSFKIRAALALGQIGGQDALIALQSALDASPPPSPSVRNVIVTAIGRLKAKTPIQQDRSVD